MKLWQNLKNKSNRQRLYKAYRDLVGRQDRVGLLLAEELAILLDELEIWKYEKYIPSSSCYIPCVVGNPKLKLTTLRALVLANRVHIKKVKRGQVMLTKVIGLKCRETGLLLQTSKQR